MRVGGEADRVRKRGRKILPGERASVGARGFVSGAVGKKVRSRRAGVVVRCGWAKWVT